MDAFGLNPILLIAQLISFGVLFFVLKRFLFGKIQQTLKERRERIHHALTAEQVVADKLKELDEQQNRLQKKNQAELKSMLAETSREAEKMKKEILAEAEARSRKIVEDAKEKIEQEKAIAYDQIRAEAKELAAAMAEKILRDSGDSTERSIQELKRVPVN